jgi:hypothetical protein
VEGFCLQLLYAGLKGLQIFRVGKIRTEEHHTRLTKSILDRVPVDDAWLSLRIICISRDYDGDRTPRLNLDI